MKPLVCFDEMSKFTPEQQKWIESLPVDRFEDEEKQLFKSIDEAAKGSVDMSCETIFQRLDDGTVKIIGHRYF